MIERNENRPTKYGIIYGMSLKEIAEKFNVTPATICNWNKNPKKRKWLAKQLKVEMWE